MAAILTKMAAILWTVSLISFLRKVCFLFNISVKLLSMAPTDNGSSLVQVMAWCRTGTYIIFFKTIGTRVDRSYQPFRSLLSDKRNHRSVSLNWTSSPNEFWLGCKIADCVLIVTNLHKLYVSNKMTSPHHRCGAVISWWRHQMGSFSVLLALYVGNSPVTGEFSSQGQWRRALMFSLIWINGWVNNREGGDLRRHRAHYDIIVM